MTKDLKQLEKTIGVKFKNPDLLRQAFVHRSYLNENPSFDLPHNERLEFLGDAVLELVVTEYLYNNFENPEGELTNWRAALVNSVMISKKASELGFNDQLYLSHGEKKDTGKARELILANTFEAVIGAIYLDQGYDVSKTFLEKNLLPDLPKIIEDELYLDPKSKFQELVQDKLGVTPTYQVQKESGPDHARHFSIGVYINNNLAGTGEGSSKQEAQISAADDALKNKKWEEMKPENGVS